ncbi:MAG: pyruvate kinase [Bacteroidetes bacterium]|nr:pyruvate kinase [Bacteroidota bacterium]MCW5894727.1 pyruvate kinase [Bacteroidota bacterium]
MMPNKHGNTKIVCTLGPSSNSVDMLMRLIQSGVDVVRFNFSHGSHEEHLGTLRNVQDAMKRTGEFITVLQDLQGPKIRIGRFTTPFVELRAGAIFTITTDQTAGDETRVSTTYTNLIKDVHPGDMILLDDGKLRVRVQEVRGTNVQCEVIVGGTLSANKGINLPNVAVSTPSLTEKDLRDLDFGIKNDVDYIALSFVRTAEDIRQLRKAIIGRIEKNRFLPIVAKIEKPQAVANIDEIIAEADAIMIARGDLGVELPPEDVPMLQKKIIRKCSAAGKPVIIATQMLESMINNPTPTRAEANDVANGVVDGADAVMLSGETSVGKYPLEAVQMMHRIITKVESEQLNTQRILDHIPHGVSSRHDALGRAACVLAEQMNASAIVCVTHSGKTARVVSRYRPRTRILAVTDRSKIMRRLNLIWGVHGIAIDTLEQDSDKALKQIQERLLNLGLIQRGEYIVLLAGQPFFARGSTNFIEVEKVV